VKLHWGQIKPSNYEMLLKHYGSEPPWLMENSPLISLVEAIVEGRNLEETAYFDFISRDREYLAGSVKLVGQLISSNNLTAVFEVESVIDGSYKVAINLVTGKRIWTKNFLPYQTIHFPNHVVPGQRHSRFPVDYDFDGKKVLDLGANSGENSIQVLQAGAREVISVDGEFTSTIWQLRNAWGFQDRMTIKPEFIEKHYDADIVLAFSVSKYLEEGVLEGIIEGRDCIYENHEYGEKHPDTSHKWTKVKDVPYSTVEPDRKREVFVGIAP